MAAENIGEIYPTLIPGYEDTADIKTALRLYHYGSESFDPAETDPTLLPNPSIARYLYEIETDVTFLQSQGLGSIYSSTLPTSAENGFIWADATSSGSIVPVYSIAVYSNSAPTTGLADGIIWIDKDTADKLTYVWDAALSQWIQINNIFNISETKGDILVANSSGDLDNLPVTVNDGYVLSADSTAALGVSWKQQAYQDDTISFVMGVY